MKRILSAITLSAVLASPVWSEPITLRCKAVGSSSEEQGWSIVLDLDKKIAEWQNASAEQFVEKIEVYPEYITGNSTQPDRGFFGIWVLDRLSLQMVELFIDEYSFSQSKPDGSVTEPKSYRHQCIRGI